jgi:uncharacterized protein (DUF58 family)
VTRAARPDAGGRQPDSGRGGKVAGWLRRWRSRAVPEGIRITKVGLWFVLLTVVVAVAATNTGNNALYLVLSAMLSLMVVSGFVSRRNLRDLEPELERPADLYARQPAALAFTLRHRGRWISRWLVLVSARPDGPWHLIPHLGAGELASGSLDVIFPRRGPQKVPAVHVASLFPLGLFRKGMRYLAASRPGWGHDLHALRSFRYGDDPRGIHWKKSAQTRSLVYREREAEETLRLSILFDEGCAPFSAPAESERFERLVSEAATAAVDHLDRGFEVELVTHGRRVAFGSGPRHRREVLELLARIQPTAPSPRTLVPGDSGALQLRLSLGRSTGAAA